MGTVPTPHTWLDGEQPDFRDLENYLEDPITFMMNPPMVRLRRVNPFVLTTGVTATISWDFVEIETENMWDASQPTKLTPSTPGWYVGHCGMALAQNVNGQREMNVRKNGAATERVLRVNHKPYTDPTLTIGNRGNVFMESFNGTTDYLEVTLFQNSGGNLNVLADSLERQCDLTLRWFAAL